MERSRGHEDQSLRGQEKLKDERCREFKCQDVRRIKSLRGNEKSEWLRAKL
jgi:hypothetical protein